MKTVLILGARAPASLEWTRIFAQAGHRVILADSVRYPLSRFSKYATRYIRVPPPKQAFKKWFQKLQQIVVEYSVELILPTCEEVFYLASVAGQFPASCHVFTSPFELLKILHHKAQFADLTQGWNVCAPQTIMLEDKASLETFRENSADWVFKPVYSRFATQVLICPTFEKLQTITPSIDCPWVAQRFVQGKEYCSFSLVRHGQVVAHSCYHPKYRVGKGAGTYLEASTQQAIQQFVAHFSAQTHYHGQVGFDFIEDASSQTYVLECNPRATSGIHLFNRLHHALASIMMQEESAAKEPIIPTNANGMLSLGMLFNTAHFKHFFTKAFWHDFNSTHDVIWDNKDTLPYWAQTIASFEMFARAAKTKTNLLAATSMDIEWDGTPIPFK